MSLPGQVTNGSTDAQIQELLQRWADAEEQGHAAALAEISTHDFSLIGPAGYVLAKSQWLARFDPGQLVTTAVTYAIESTQRYATTAIVIGSLDMASTFQGHGAGGSFRSTHVVVEERGRLLLAHIQLSPKAPFAASASTHQHADATAGGHD